MQFACQNYFDSIPARISPLFTGILCEELWRVLPSLEAFIMQTIQPGNHGTIHGDAHIQEAVEIGEGTIIEHGAVIKGPTIIGKNCEIRSGAYIRGGVITGDHCVIGHTSEVIRSVLFDGVRLDHFNYVGDSLLGNKVHFGAGAKVANLRFDEEQIVIDDIPTDLKKFGAILGDACQLGVNTSIGPGVVLEKNVWFAPLSCLPSGRYTRESVKAHLDASGNAHKR